MWTLFKKKPKMINLYEKIKLNTINISNEKYHVIDNKIVKHLYFELVSHRLKSIKIIIQECIIKKVFKNNIHQRIKSRINNNQINIIRKDII